MAKKTIKTESIMEPEIIEPAIETPKISEKEKLIEIYEFLKSRGIHSISDIENLIARA